MGIKRDGEDQEVEFGEAFSITTSTTSLSYNALNTSTRLSITDFGLQSLNFILFQSLW